MYEKNIEQRKRKWVIIPLMILIIAVAAVVWVKHSTADDLRAYELLKQYAEAPELTMDLTVDAQYGGEHTTFTARLYRTMEEEHSISVVETAGVPLYYADGTVFLENGKAFRISDELPDYSNLLTAALLIYEQVDISAENGIYRITADEAQTQELLSMLLPGNRLPGISVTVELATAEETLTAIRFVCDSADLALSAELAVVDAHFADVTVPDAVRTAISTGAYSAVDLLTDSTFALLRALEDMNSREVLTAGIRLSADCGPLVLSDSVNYTRWNIDGQNVNAVQKNDIAVYFTNGVFCDADGNLLTETEVSGLEAAELIGAAYMLFLTGDYQSAGSDDAYIYTLTLDQSTMEEIAYAIAPTAEDLNIRLSDGKVTLTVSDDVLQTLTISCTGSMYVILANISVHLGADVSFDYGTKPELPVAVQNALLK